MPVEETSAFLEELKHTLYDSVTLCGSFSRAELFRTPFGINSKTLADTNMSSRGLLPAHRFIATRIRMELLGISPEDRARVERSYLLEFIINCKIYWQGPVSTLLLEDRLRQSIALLSDEKGRALTKYLDRSLRNGFLHHLRNGFLNLGGTTPTVLSPHEQFFVIISDPSGPHLISKTFTARVFLDGTLYRPAN